MTSKSRWQVWFVGLAFLFLHAPIALAQDTDGDGLSDAAELAITPNSFSCAGTNCAATGCTWYSYGGHNYLLCSSAKTWADAREFCRSYGGDLVAMNDSGENFTLSSAMSSFRLGFNDVAAEGTWVWSHGAPSPASFTNWWPIGEPGIEDCAISNGGFWYDSPCGSTGAFVCEDHFASNPFDPDSDGDGVKDGPEAAQGSHPNLRESDGDGINDLFDNCPANMNAGQADLEEQSPPWATPVLTNNMNVFTWGSPVVETGLTVHDGATAFISDDNDYFTGVNLGTVGSKPYLRFWVNLPANTSDMLFQVACDGDFSHRWGLSADGVWDGLVWSVAGTSYHLPLAQWTPVTLDLRELGCATGQTITGLAFSLPAGRRAYFDSVHLSAAAPRGNVCDTVNDFDGDGLTDAAEVVTWLTDPADADTDNDGLSDYDEVITWLTEPLLADTDGDGLNDYAEVITWLTDPWDTDSDNDGLTDGAEVNTWLTDPLDNDTDGDGSPDDVDCGPLDPNNWISCAACADLDGDSWLDNCDAYITINGPDCDEHPVTGNLCHQGCVTYYADADSDTYGGLATATDRCAAPSGYIATGGDCNDNNSAVKPGAAETCNGVDDNCAAGVDETFPNLGGACSAGVGACLVNGVMVCKADGTGTECNAVPGQPTAEMCNGINDDCDAETDEDFDLGAICTAGVGACVNSGVKVCRADGTGTQCNAIPGTPAAEMCNGINDDCDAQTDEDFDLGAICPVGVGACARDGVKICRADHTGTECSGTPGQPAAETCNAIDDDCDNLTDEDFDLGASCASGVGACARDGVKVCRVDHTGTECDAVPGPPGAETCNLIDDDCDTVVDNGVQTTYYHDGDSDGYGDPADTTLACSAPTGYVADPTDCDDADPNNWAACAACQDGDNDGYFVGCDAYVTLSGPDCHAAAAACTDNCLDGDNDGLALCAGDCDDADPDSDDDGLCDGNTHFDLICAIGEDLDGDGVVDAGETDPCLADTDGDGLLDGAEVFTWLTDPKDNDTDGDQMPDGWEAQYSICGLDPLIPDGADHADRDPFTNLQEFQQGGNPCLVTACNDGIDNDGDGRVDLLDPGCPDRADNSEFGATACDNGLDDDLDGWIDFRQDPDCSGPEGGEKIYEGPLTPTPIGSYTTSPENAVGVAVAGNYAYLAEENGHLRILDVSNPASPNLISSWNVQPYNGAYPKYSSVMVTGGHALMTTLMFATTVREVLEAVEVGNPASPSLIDVQGYWETAGAYCYGLDIANDYVYLVGTHLWVVQLTADHQLIPMGTTVPLPATARDIAVSGNLALVADGTAGLLLYSLNNPIAPAPVSSLDTGGDALGVAVAGNFAYVADGEAGLQVIDISNPASPTHVSTLDSAGTARDVAVSNGMAFVAGDTAGLQAIDVSNPASPSLVWTHDTPGQALKVFLANDLIYVADGTGGLRIVRYNRVYDRDGDLTPDWWESAHACADADSVDAINDPDLDGLTNYQEYLNRTDPCDNDSDNDGLADGPELNAGADPLLPDSDGDGLSDYEEVVTYGSDPTSLDSDGDGISDPVESLHGLDPANADSDGDGLSDPDEAFLQLTDPGADDTDGDGMTDGWEAANACLSALLADAAADPDGDGETNQVEFGNSTDPCAITDSDADGMSDWWESQYTSCGLNPAVGDSLGDPDADGRSNLAEYLGRTDPCVSNLVLDSPRLVNYQGRLMDSADQPVNGAVTMTFSLFDGETSGLSLWRESHLVTVSNGLYSVVLGGDTVIPSSAMTWPELYLEIEVEGEILVPRQRITAAIHAISADLIGGQRFETGAAALAVSPAAGVKTVHVSFAQLFTEPPRVAVTSPNALVGSEKFVATRIFNLTAAGFDVEWTSLSGAPASGSAEFSYLAFGK